MPRDAARGADGANMKRIMQTLKAIAIETETGFLPNLLTILPPQRAPIKFANANPEYIIDVTSFGTSKCSRRYGRLIRKIVCQATECINVAMRHDMAELLDSKALNPPRRSIFSLLVSTFGKSSKARTKPLMVKGIAYRNRAVRQEPMYPR